MTLTSRVPEAAGCHLGSGCGYPAPGYPQSYTFNPLFTIGHFKVIWPMLLAVVCAGLVIAFFSAAFRKPQLVPEAFRTWASLAYCSSATRSCGR